VHSRRRPRELLGEAAIAVWAIGGGLAFGLFAFFVLKPLLARAGAWVERKKAYDSFALPGRSRSSRARPGTRTWSDLRRLRRFVLGAAMPRGEIAKRIEAQVQP
jgi:hypothetical protein